MLSYLTAATLTFAIPGIQPDVNIEAVRHIDCPSWSGSGFVIADDIIATANHVVDKGCIDTKTGTKLVAYYQDPEHDFALMTGKLPYIVPIKYDCIPYRAGKTYIAYGLSSYPNLSYPITRASTVYALGKGDKRLRDGTLMKGIWSFRGRTVPGMSGGPYLSIETMYVRGIVNAGNSINSSLSYSLSDTILCPRPKK